MWWVFADAKTGKGTTMSDDEKACPVCAETIKAAAIKCRFCNTDLKAFAETQDSEIETTIFSGNPAPIYSAWQVVAVVFTLGLAFLFFKAKSLAVRYEITTQRIKIERGYLEKVQDNFELFTIEHFEIWSSWGMRLAGYSVLQMRFSDFNGPAMCIYGVEDLQGLADKLRECSFKERTRRRITSLIRP